MDRYDAMNNPISYANMLAASLASVFNQRGIGNLKITAATYETDAEVNIDEKTSIQITLEGSYIVVKRNGNNFAFSQPLESVKAIFHALDN